MTPQKRFLDFLSFLSAFKNINYGENLTMIEQKVTEI